MIMHKLIRLELKKNNLKPYVIAVFGIFIFTLLTVGMMLNFPHIPGDTQIQMMTTSTGLPSVIAMLYMNCFSILAAVMYSKFVIDEYVGKRKVLLFSYPQKRSTILFAKFLLIFGFSFLLMCILNFITTLLVIFIGNQLGLVKGALTLDTVITVTLISFVFSIIANLIGMIAMRIGFWKKSVIWTIVTAIIFVSPLGNAATFITQNLFVIIVPVFLVLLIICVTLFMSLLKKVNNMECV